MRQCEMKRKRKKERGRDRERERATGKLNKNNGIKANRQKNFKVKATHYIHL